ncbi:MAG: hypothetical protein Q4G69_05150 [Planctomycetia bacterium]|nr:hypothetical protein [Planctomycetia bacterium]
MKAIVLFSGGLDSLLTTRILEKQGYTVIGLNIITPFFNGSKEAQKRADEMGIELVIRRFSDDYIRMLQDPKYGYGKAINPCIDCRIMMCKEAAKVMEEYGADFVATGEVAGQRPNSQKIHQLKLIERESELNGKLVRPLSAKVLAATEPEKEGKLRREELFSFTGRFRGGLISMGKYKFDLPLIPQPSTGCLLCEKSFAPRIRDLLKYKKDPACWDIDVLLAGRQYRIDENTKCAIGRREADCDQLQILSDRKDRSPSVFLVPDNYYGAAILLINDHFSAVPNTPEDLTEEQNRLIDLAGAFCLHYTNPAKYMDIPEGPRVLVQMGDFRFARSIHPNESLIEKFETIKETKEG